MREQQYSRRRVLREGLATLGLVAVGGRPSSAEAIEHSQQVRRRLKEDVRLTSTAMELLTPSEIRTELKKCRFLDQVKVHLTHLDTPIIQNPFAEVSPGDRFPHDSLDENVELARQQKKLRLDPSGLNVISANFHRLSLGWAGALYEPRHSAIFIRETVPSAQDFLEEQLFKRAVELEALSQEEKKKGDTAASQEISEWAVEQQRRGGRLSDIPDDWLVAHAPQLTERLEHFATQGVLDRVQQQAAISHEAAHYFFDRLLFTEGYEGPTLVEIFEFAVQQMHQRAKPLPRFANWMANLKEATFLKDISMELFKKYKITQHSEQKTQEELKTMSSAEQEEYKIQQELITFISEYFARIYAATLGHTTESQYVQSTQALEVQGLSSDRVARSTESYLDPTPEELAFVQSIRFNGQPIV